MCQQSGVTLPPVSVDAKIRIRVNSPPRVGRLDVTFSDQSDRSSDKPLAVTSVFRLSQGKQWVDQQPPFKYLFGYEVGKRKVDRTFSQRERQFPSTSNVFWLQAAPTNRDSISTTLPVPGRCGDRAMTLVVQVRLLFLLLLLFWFLLLLLLLLLLFLFYCCSIVITIIYYFVGGG